MIDFTGKTSFEIADILNRNISGTCGRLTQEQLNFVYEFIPDAPAKVMWFRRGVIGAAFAFLVGVFNTKAADKVDKPVVEINNKIAGEKLLPVINDEPVDTNKFIIEGVVVADSNEAVPFANIEVGDVHMGITDVKGKFKFEVMPNQLQQGQCKLEVMGFGFEKQEVIVSRKDIGKPLVIKLNYRDIGGDIVGRIVINPKIEPVSAKPIQQYVKDYFGVID